MKQSDDGWVTFAIKCALAALGAFVLTSALGVIVARLLDYDA